MAAVPVPGLGWGGGCHLRGGGPCSRLLPPAWHRSEFPSSPAAVGSACLMDHTPSELDQARISGRQDSVFHGSHRLPNALRGKKMSLREGGRGSTPRAEFPHGADDLRHHDGSLWAGRWVSCYPSSLPASVPFPRKLTSQ